MSIKTEQRKNKSRLAKVFSKLLNFLCAAAIAFIVMFAIGAFVSADKQSKDMLGDYDSQIFSFNKTDDNNAELIIFGEKFIMNLDTVNAVQNKFNELAQVNKEYTPSIFILCGDIISSCLSSIGESFGKIPEIVEYFYMQSSDN